MKIERITPNIGALVSGIDLAEIGLADRDWLCDLLDEHLVVAFVGQSLSIEQFQRFGEAVGDLEITPIVPGVRASDDPVHAIEILPGTRRGRHADRWHSDVHYREKPPYATILMPEQLPALGGDTHWASMYAAYDLLSPPLRRFADELYVVQAVSSDKCVEEHVHPLLRVNPKTGRRGLYINGIFTREFAGVSVEESEQLKDMFVALATQPDVQMRYRWTPDSVVIWDNRFTQHYACNDYDERRRLLRMTVKGEPVVGVRPREYAF